ncbi:MAG: hypothetical protein FJ388_23280, partial [Verrucomicrobia bacterium]|nr:hypothetical protein [Verrucomicrobiota bacterium]
MKKLQIPNSKLQGNTKPQAPRLSRQNAALNPRTEVGQTGMSASRRTSVLGLNSWCLEFLWSLALGVRSFARVALLCLALQLSAAAGSPLTLWYRQPAAKGMNEALPIGNGRIGALIYGGVATERLVLNDSSFWTGTEISSDDYSKMGSYQMLGELLVTVSGGNTASITSPVVSCPSGHKAFYEKEELAYSFDGKAGTKWCVEHHDQPVVWEARLPEAKAVAQYTLTSANDSPKRDPSTWEFAGSADGKAWTTLDKHSSEPTFGKRGEAKQFAFTNDKPFRFYRFTFQPNAGMKHFQVGEIAMAGVTPMQDTALAAVEDYRRSLDLATATHVVSHK